jgi:hypothetical protein
MFGFGSRLGFDLDSIGHCGLKSKNDVHKKTKRNKCHGLKRWTFYLKSCRFLLEPGNLTLRFKKIVAIF